MIKYKKKIYLLIIICIKNTLLNNPLNDILKNYLWGLSGIMMTSIGFPVALKMINAKILKNKFMRNQHILNYDLYGNDQSYNLDFYDALKVFLKDSNHYKLNGLILFGSPGVGKTQSVRLLAKKLKKNLHIIPIKKYAEGDGYVNVGEGIFLTLSEHLVYIAQTKNPIVLIDEIDKIDTKKGLDFLLNFIAKARDMGIIIIATSNNSPENLSIALTRFGRLGYNINVKITKKDYINIFKFIYKKYFCDILNLSDEEVEKESQRFIQTLFDSHQQNLLRKKSLENTLLSSERIEEPSLLKAEFEAKKYLNQLINKKKINL